MFDIWLGDMNLSVVLLNITVAIVLPVQLLLCFKVKSRTARFMPLIILSLLVVGDLVMYSLSYGWDGLIYIFGAIYAAIMMLMSGIGWGIWAIVKFVKKRK